jgi:hypothetical protein
MSNSTELNPVPSDNRVLFSALGFIGVFGIVAVVVWLTYLQNRPAPIDQAIVQNRIEILNKVTGEQYALTSEYARTADGKIRIPVERAKDWIVGKLSLHTEAPISPIATQTEPVIE